MDILKFKERLKRYKENDIVFTRHANIQAYVREMDLNEIKNNILNPEKLVYYKQQRAERVNEEKYECYFAYSSTYYHKYVIIVDGKLIICTVIKINRRWQREAEKHGKL